MKVPNVNRIRCQPCGDRWVTATECPHWAKGCSSSDSKHKWTKKGNPTGYLWRCKGCGVTGAGVPEGDEKATSGNRAGDSGKGE